MRIRPALLAGSAAVLALTLAACSSTDSDPVTPAPAESSATAMPAPASSDPAVESEAPVESEVALPAPIMVDETATTAAAAVGDSVVFVMATPDGSTIEVSDPAMFEVSQGGTVDGVVLNPGVKAIAPGTATVTITSADGTVRTVDVTISEPAEDSAAAQDAALVAASEEACKGILAAAMSLEDAQAVADSGGFTLRVLSVDGEDKPATADYSPTRLNLKVDNGMVTGCLVG